MSTKAMTIEGKEVLVTGANRGLGQALVEEALRRGAMRVYAGTRQPLVHPDECVTPLTLDVTEPAQVQAAVERVDSLDVLINNAGVALTTELSDRAALSIDTDMIRDLDIPKASPRAVARGIFDGVKRGEEEIFPDPMSEKMAASWRMGAAKALERQNGALVAGTVAA
jgi:NAD(P)-dependent dehydrogenase (short-subunit alcohol dehydrogenase family)